MNTADMPESSVPKLYRWELVFLLWGAFFLNQGDRQVFSAVIKLIEADLGFSGTQLGLVATIFTICYGIFVPIAGYAGDVFRRRDVVFLSLLVFSVGTLLTGLVSGLVLLIVFRSFATGIGEAFYYPAANSLIAQYHEKSRATAMAIHQTANYTGVVIGGTLAGWVGATFGWRYAFLTFGVIGIVWALYFLLRIRDDRQDRTREEAQATETTEKIPVSEALRNTMFNRTLWLLSLAFGGMVFVNIGFLTWMPTFLIEKFSLSIPRANFDAMFYHHLAAYFGVLIAARISDRLAATRGTVRLETGMIGLFFGAPFIYLMGSSGDLWLVYAALAGFGFFRGVYDSNLFASLFDVLEPKYRATGSGLMLAFAFLIGSASPLLLGWARDHVDLDTGITLLAAVYLVSSILIFIARQWTFHRDEITVNEP